MPFGQMLWIQHQTRSESFVDLHLAGRPIARLPKALEWLPTGVSARLTLCGATLDSAKDFSASTVTGSCWPMCTPLAVRKRKGDGDEAS